LGLGDVKKVTCSNVGKIELEVAKMAVCDTRARLNVKNKVPKRGLIKEFCPNVCGECMK